MPHPNAPALQLALAAGDHHPVLVAQPRAKHLVVDAVGHAQRRDRIARLLREDIEADRPAGRSRRAGQPARFGPDILDPLIANGRQRLAGRHDQRNRRRVGRVEVRGQCLTIRLQAIVVRRAAERFGGRPRAIVYGHETEPRRQHHRLLGSRGYYVHAPGVHAQRQRAGRGHGIHDQQCMMLPRHPCNRLEVARRARRGFAMDDDDIPDRRIGGEVLRDPVRTGRRPPFRVAGNVINPE